MLPIAFYPFSKTIFLAVDLWMHHIDNPDAQELESSRLSDQSRH